MREFLKDNRAYYLSFLGGAFIAIIVSGIWADGAGYEFIPWVLGAFFIAEVVKFIAWRIEQKEE
ncbi:hypothetical protein [Planococcus maritimus]|uniref:hypothetical protein n=1 Tax=Planococcus maritimus TaxID=192421 RepID=UPI000799FF07|nr:hypothetical protein [Planococcus maritimus]KYG59478.1 hypothetical protein AY633_04335 [Planococcus maritimus]